MTDKTFKDKLYHYINAGFPIIYLNTFEEDKVDSIIQELRLDREVYEWNETNGYIEFENKTPLLEDCTLEMTLDQIKTADMLEGKLILLKDVNAYLEDARIVSKIKGLAKMIVQGVSANIIIVSNILTIPRELEKFITILEMDYLSSGEIREIIENFIRACELEGILEMIPLKETMNDIGGLENLKLWFKQKAKVFRHMEEARTYGVDVPKGVLIAGVPGCGKSLNAEAIAPCVLWIDELEKAFAGIGSDGGGAEVTTRLFGNFLTWMQEKNSPVFVVATANDITKLPPELLRKGRFDEIFYVGLPNSEERDHVTTEDIRRAVSSTHSLSEIMKDSLDQMAKEYEKRKIKNASR